MAAKINLKVNGKDYACLPGTSLQIISRDFKNDYPHEIIIARKNGKLIELFSEINEDCEIDFLTTGDELGNNALRRTACMVMIKAVRDLYGKDQEVKILYSLDKGYYCELQGMTTGPERAEEIRRQMQVIIDDKLPIIKRNIPMREAADIMKTCGLYDKEALCRFRRSSSANLYFLGDTVDYFYGYMAPDTSYVECFDICAYNDGFVLQLPDRKHPERVEPFQPSEKLFSVLLQSSRWYDLMDVSNVADLNRAIAEGRFYELILVQEALQEERIAKIADMIAGQGKRVILIAGPSSSGKTTFSHRLSIQLRVRGLKPHPIPVDNYFVDREDTPKDENGNYDFECLEAVDLKRFNADMKALLETGEAEIPVFNFITGRREHQGKKMKIGPSDVLVIEGIHALNDTMTSEIVQELKFKIYISALTQLNMDDHNRFSTTDGRLLRRMCRDSVTRGADAQRTIRMWPQVRKGEEQNIFPYQESCDVMFNSELLYELPVLKQFAEPLLFSVPRDAPEYDEAKRMLKLLNYFLGYTSEKIPNNSIIREFIGGSCFDVS